ncbi:MAG: hypothetical protein ACK4UJ_02320 [Leptonema sp. (in: bacteria)]
MKAYVLVFFVVFSFYCKTFQQSTQSIIEEKDKEYQETQDTKKQDQILKDMYAKKDQVPENQKDSFVDFFMNKDSKTSEEILQNLYEDPNFSDQRKKIFDYNIKNLNSSNVDFVKREIREHPEYYTISLKQELLKLESKEAAEVLLDQIYLERQELDGEILYLFKKTHYVEALPVVVDSIEKQKYVEESFSTLSEFRVEEADLYLINTASDWSHPYREFALSYLYKIDNKPLAISIYIDVIRNHKEKPNLVLKTLQGIEELFEYLTEENKKEIQNLLPEIEKKYPDFPLVKLNQLKKAKKILEQENKEKTEISESKRIEIPPNKKQENIQSKEEVQQKKKQIKQPQKTKEVETKSYKLPAKDLKYMQKLGQKFFGLFGEEGSQILKKIHNSLLTYSDSNTERAKLIQKAYESCFRIFEKEKIREYLKQGLYVNKSWECVLNFIDKQYIRDDLKIFALQELFLIKRKEASEIIRNKKRF